MVFIFFENFEKKKFEIFKNISTIRKLIKFCILHPRLSVIGLCWKYFNIRFNIKRPLKGRLGLGSKICKIDDSQILWLFRKLSDNCTCSYHMFIWKYDKIRTNSCMLHTVCSNQNRSLNIRDYDTGGSSQMTSTSRILYPGRGWSPFHVPWLGSKNILMVKSKADGLGSKWMVYVLVEFREKSKLSVLSSQEMWVNGLNRWNWNLPMYPWALSLPE